MKDTNYIKGYEIKEKKEYLDISFLMSLLPKDFKFKRQPMYHQLLSLVFSLQFSNGVANFSEMGAGKTKVAIDYLRALGIKKNILVLTKNSIVTSFANQFTLDSDYTVKAFTTESKAERNKIIEENGFDVYIMNYESIFTGNKKSNKVKDFILPVLKDKKWEATVFDESRTIMNIKSKTTKAALWISSNSKVRILLCGLPIAKKEYEIFAQQLALDHGQRFGTSYYGFLENYYNKYLSPYGNYPIYQLKEGKEEEIKQKMYEQAIRFKKSECLDLPPVVYEDRFIELEGDQLAAYKKLLAANKAVIVDKDNKLEVKRLLVKFRQICGGFIKESKDEKNKQSSEKEEKVIIFKSNAKLKELISILEELQNDKVVIFAYFRTEQKQIYETLVKFRKDVLRLTADITKDEFNRNKELFQTDPNYKILVASLEMASRGIDLTASKYCVFYSLDFDTEMIKQAEERFQRPGSEWADKITLIRLLCRNTVDDKRLLKVLKDDFTTIDKLVDGERLIDMV